MRNPIINSTLIAGLLGLGLSTAYAARDNIMIVGSSTVYPFATVVAEHFGKNTRFKTPKIESTGSGGGLKLFCAGAGVDTPDITNASRKIKASEIETCRKNGVTEIVEVKIGYDGIAIANSRTTAPLTLTLHDLFLALAKEVPAPDGSETLVANPYKTWKDVNSTLPDTAIEVLGPPPTSGTRDAFVELAMEGGCDTFAWIKAMKKVDKNAYQTTCQTIREDGAFIEAGENDNLIVQKLEANPKAVGIFGFSFLDQNSDKIQGSIVEGVAPDFETIASGEYPVSRPLFFYVKKTHVGSIPGITEYLAEFTSERAWGENGYLSDKGLIPMPAEERSQMAKIARDLTTM
jgi:phosphate transport system substrate-binding protein